MALELALVPAITALVKGLGGTAKVQPALGGVRPDLLLRGPNGRTMVLEVKNWKADAADIERAIRQATAYREVTGADEALVVLPGKGRGDVRRGWVFEDELESVLQDRLSAKPSAHPRRLKVVGGKKRVFAALPFAPRYDDVFFVAMAYAAKSAGAGCLRVDRDDFTGDVVARIHEMIRESDAVIADLSEGKPNVLYETGFAHGVDKPTIHISSTPVDKLPFDVRNWNTMPYTAGRTHELRAPLGHRLRALIGKAGTVS